MINKLFTFLFIILISSCGGGGNSDIAPPPDSDGDGILDVYDLFPSIPIGSLVDTDRDGAPDDCDSDCLSTGMNADSDDDGDGVLDVEDEAPLNINVHTLPKPSNALFVIDHLTVAQDIGQLSGTSQNNRPITCSIVDNAIIGTINISDSSSCQFIYTGLENITSNTTDSFTFKVNDGYIDSSEVATVSLSIKADPLYLHQWYADNTGQNSFAGQSGLFGEDINVDKAWAEGYKGLGINIAIIDSGLEIAHEDLEDNIAIGKSFNFVDETPDPTSSRTDGDHGTSVAGLAASVGWNNKGARGIAPKASLRGFNFLMSQAMSNQVAALGGADYANDVDIFNLSYGPRLEVDTRPYTQVEDALINGVNNLRNGLGSIYVKSAGNGFRLENENDPSPSCRQLNISCRNTAMDPHNSLPYYIVVAASNALGVKSTYSTAGSANWVTAPGGQSGNHPDYRPFSQNYGPAMLTTDQSGCDRGYTTRIQKNAFQAPENSNCNYTSTFNGTSSSAPVLSGAIALILEVNSSLTWRDVKHILATTSVQIDPSISDNIVEIDGQSYIAEPAWLINGAGYKFHNWYGFGRIDAYAAVVAAKNYVSGSLGNYDYTNKTNQTMGISIPDNSVTGAAIDIMMTDNLVIESVELTVGITHPSIGELGIELISPSGTRSVMFTIRNSFYDENDFNDFRIASNAFYGENVVGTWKCKVIDSLNGNIGTLNSCGVKFYGH